MTSEVMSIRGMSVGQATPEKLRQAIVRAFHEEGLSYCGLPACWASHRPPSAASFGCTGRQEA